MVSMHTRGLAGGYVGSANPAVEEGARARKGRETSVKLELRFPRPRHQKRFRTWVGVQARP